MRMYTEEHIYNDCMKFDFLLMDSTSSLLPSCLKANTVGTENSFNASSILMIPRPLDLLAVKGTESGDLAHEEFRLIFPKMVEFPYII